MLCTIINFSILFDFLISFIENYVIILILKIYLPSKKENSLAFALLITVISTLINNYFKPPIFCFIFLLIILYIYVFFCLKGSTREKIIIPFIIFCNVFLIDMSLLVVCSIIGIDVTSFLGIIGTKYFAISSFQKIILIIEYIFLKSYARQKLYFCESIMILSVFFMIVSMIVPEIVLTQYMNGIIRSKSLLLVSFSQFFINYILLYKIFIKINDEHLKFVEKEILIESKKGEEKLLNEIEKKIDEINRLSHDINNHKLVISQMINNSDQEIKKYVDDLFPTDSYVSTNNQVLNYLLNDKLRKAEGLNIDVKCLIEGDFESSIALIDLSIVLGNLLDNAIEATLKTNEKHIKLRMRQDEFNLVINISNTYNGVVYSNNNILLTSKYDDSNHGYGLSNIKQVCKKYNGESFITYDDKYFYHSCIFNLK